MNSDWGMRTFDQDDGSGAGLMKDLPQLLASVDPQRTTRNEIVERERKREVGWVVQGK